MHENIIIEYYPTHAHQCPLVYPDAVAKCNQGNAAKSVESARGYLKHVRQLSLLIIPAQPNHAALAAGAQTLAGTAAASVVWPPALREAVHAGRPGRSAFLALWRRRSGAVPLSFPG